TEVVKRERIPADEIIRDYIIRDLEAAEKIMAVNDPIVTDGVLSSSGESTADNWYRYRQLRLNYYAVILLKARAYMWIADYDNALAEARKITDSAKAAETFPWVAPNRLLGNSTNPDRIFSTECLFGYYDNSLGDVYKNAFSAVLEASSVRQPARNYVNNTLFPDVADYRYLSQWSSNSSLSSGYEFIKYKSFTTNANNPDFWATFYGLLRKTEAYYIAAECQLNLDNNTAALGYLNTVLVARGLPELDPETSKAKIQKEIELEYVRELRGEGQSFFTLKRLNAYIGEYYSGCKPHLCGATNPGFDSPSKALRYNVPIPSGETY
ncbi:MAG: RagB/SusD family nutrient uptake outer membrane protein, partial [Duncaniella sp.]|nr:RagB/SusD family nutrient uptake outer membrane protein [Duncaniella sp.]